MKLRSRQGITPVAALVLLLGGLTLGVYLERFGLLPSLGQDAPPSARQAFAPFWQAWRLVERFYVDRAAVEPHRMTAGAIRGMLAALGDVGHTTYLTPEEVKEMKASLQGELEGIGARMTVRNHQPTIVETIAGSPARAAGLRPGDILMEVNGKAVTTLSLEQIVKLVRGPAGTTVHLRVLRAAEASAHDRATLGVELIGLLAAPQETGYVLAAAIIPENHEIQSYEIRRAKVDVPTLAWCMVPGQPLGHIALREFGAYADIEIRETIKKAQQRGARGLIIDVRGNPGGLKDQAVKVTSEFLRDGNVFVEKDANGHSRAVPVQPGGIATDIPLILLIDEGTASSAEIFAGALQDHDRAKVVGTRSFGTGTVLLELPLSDGSAVLLAVEEWLTPKGRVIWHKGIAPDIEVKLPEGARVLLPEEETRLRAADLPQIPDLQFREALAELRRQLGR